MVKAIHLGEEKLRYKTNAHCLVSWSLHLRLGPPFITGGCIKRASGVNIVLQVII